MVEAVRDRSLDWLCSASSSSSAFERVLEGSANCSNVKGWDELVNLYSAGVHAGDVGLRCFMKVCISFEL